MGRIQDENVTLGQVRTRAWKWWKEGPRGVSEQPKSRISWKSKVVEKAIFHTKLNQQMNSCFEAVIFIPRCSLETPPLIFDFKYSLTEKIKNQQAQIHGLYHFKTLKSSTHQYQVKFLCRCLKVN